jgi:hypothetical protein
MIGRPLSIKEMDRIVKQLEDVEYPWNCPHGRPTMRHLGDKAHIMLEDEKKAAEHIAGPTVTARCTSLDIDGKDWLATADGMVPGRPRSQCYTSWHDVYG